MRRREIINLLSGVAVGWSSFARAQQPAERVRRVGVLTPSLVQLNREVLQRALEQRGHKEGVNLLLIIMSADGQLERLASLVEQIAREELDVIVAVNSPTTRAILAAPGSTPVVMAMVSDPIVLGFVDSLSRPGGRVTGVANVIQDLAQKRLALLKEAVPRLRRVTALLHPDDPITEPQRQQIADIAPSLGLQVDFVPVRNSKEVEEAFWQGLAAKTDAFFVVAGQSGVIAARLVELARQHRVPAAVPIREQVRWGGLMSYSADEVDHWERVAIQVDRLLRGASPSQIPVEQPTKFNLVLNMRTAREIGVEFPANLLARANEVIE
jgi:putative tryptophan/tyrosine transport system substrate-binding protein